MQSMVGQTLRHKLQPVEGKVKFRLKCSTKA
jgi:hypothetical protein